MIGSIVTREELLARWAFAETRSSRFGPRMRRAMSHALQECLARVTTFGDVAQSDWQDLIRAVTATRKEPSALFDLGPGADRFVCGKWTATELLNCMTLPVLGSTSFFRLLALPPFRTKDRSIHPNDLRHAASEIPFDQHFTVVEPVIAIPSGERPMLIDGYLRSILWLRNPVGHLPVWLPELPAQVTSLATGLPAL